jgi:hypothetical protein
MRPKMSAPFTEKNDEVGADVAAEVALPVQALTPGLLRRSLAQIREATHEAVARWEEQLAKLPRGLDFDLRGSRAGVLDRLRKSSESLAKSVSSSHDAALQASLSHLAVPLEAFKAHGSAPAAPDADNFIKEHGDTLDRMGADIASAGHALRQLADLAVRGAADLDPHSVNRILERRRDLGDATLRRVEDKIATTRSRKDKKRLQDMRDDMRNWLANRDARLESVQPIVDELALRTDVLRMACVVQSRRLARAAEFTGRASGTRDSRGGLSQRAQTSREAMEFSACLRALLLAAHVDMTAPLEQS